MAVNKLKEILDTATQFETDAYEFYSAAINIVKDPSAKVLLKEFADVELTHKEKLENIDLSKIEEQHHTIDDTHDLHISEYLLSKEVAPDSSVQDIMIHAMKREQKSYEFYSKMVKIVSSNDVRSLFEELAVEELQHKEKIETEYDDVVFKEN
ncbi:MAG: ferritin family protein [Planctomycetes bacterium]|nr:ferritin family protein [Planctomycetota bacterium]